MTGEMSIDQRVAMLENEVREINRIIARNLEGVLPPAQHRLVFSWPVGDITRRTLAPWIDMQGWATTYPVSMGRKDWHTGADLNLNVPVVYSDVNAEVYACADGVIRFAGAIKGWQGEIVIIEHTLEDGRLIWSRYAHILAATPYGSLNARTQRGFLIGHIADYLPKGPSMDHLHFDIAWCDLGKKPGDWPNTDIARLKIDYVDPIKWIEERLL